jgi:Flp pilus assembly protein TadG
MESAGSNMKRFGFGSDEGASAVEFALVAGILVLLLVGITQFGVTFYQWLEMEHAAREGARWASLCNPDDSTRAVVKAAAPGIALGDGNISIDPSNPGVSEWNKPVKVTITYTSPVFTALMRPFLGGSSVNLKASATQKVE